ncbi:putative DnaJ domain, Chaperone J-domain superfamily [Dioscorea sansibarensis]
MLIVCEILCSSKIELPGCGIDYYWLLRLFPSVESSVIEERYHKLVSLLKPIKQLFPGTNMALEFLDNAYAILSDPVERAAFDAKRNGTYYCDEKGGAVPLLEDSHQKSNCIADQIDYYDFRNIRKPGLFSVGQVWVVYDKENRPRRYARIDNIHSGFLMQVTWLKPCPASLFEKLWCNSGLPVACGQYNIDTIETTLNGHMMFSHILSNYKPKQSLEVYPQKFEVWAIYKDWNTEWCSKPGLRKSSGFEIVEILTDYMKDVGVSVVRLVKVDGFKNVYRRRLKRGKEICCQISASNMVMFSHGIPAFRFVGGEIHGITCGMLELDPIAVPHNLISLAATTANETAEEIKFRNVENQKPNWSANDFKAGEVWAVYAGPDAMPQAFVEVRYVVSPSKVCVAFLENHLMTNEELKWVENSLPIVCGVFHAGKRTVSMEMSRFSHIVDCHKSSMNSFYRIFPRKGEIWAMYKNWNIRWKKSDLVGYQCRIVEILGDYSDENGISVCNLIEVPGCMTLFHRKSHEGFQLTMQVPKLEMLSFSHQIPAFAVRLTRNDCIPQGSWYLEPKCFTAEMDQLNSCSATTST